MNVYGTEPDLTRENAIFAYRYVGSFHMCTIYLRVDNKNSILYFEHFDHGDTSHRTGQSSTLQYCRCDGGGCGHILSGTTMVFSPPRVTS